MAGSVNKVILIGNLGKDPEVRHLENGTVVANFTLATSETYTDKKTNQKVEHTDWHDVVVWRGLAEIVEKYVHKGTKVYVEGKLRKRSYQDSEGNTRYVTEIVADELTILSRPDQGQRTQQEPYTKTGTPPAPSRMDDIINNEEAENDLPF